MRAAAGQAARWCARVLHLLAAAALALGLLLAGGLGALAWRLSQGPLEIGWLAHRLEGEANTPGSPTRLSIGGAALAWEGFNKGVDRPLDLRLRNIRVVGAGGVVRARIPRAAVSFSVGWLLLGRLVPRAIAVDGARLRVIRTVDGNVQLDLGGLDTPASTQATPGTGGESWSALLAGFSVPPQNDHGGTQVGAQSTRWSQLRRVDIDNAAIAVDDRQLGLQWRAPRVDIGLRRAAAGGLSGQTTIALSLGNQKAELTVQASLRGDGTAIDAQLTPVQPAGIAATTPALISLAALDAPVTLSGHAELDADLRVRRLQARATIGKGFVHIATGALPIEAAQLTAQGTGNTLDVTLQKLTLLGHDGGQPTNVQGQVHGVRDAAGVQLTGTVALDQIAFADLPDLWPQGLAGKGTRPWITQNITAGTAADLNMNFSLRMAADLTGPHLTAIGGGFAGHDITVHWLRPVPPIVHGEARLVFRDPDTIDILVQSGLQSGGAGGSFGGGSFGGGMAIKGGSVTLSGLSAKDQFADIEADLAGPVADLIAVLKNPRIKILDRSPVKLNDPAGTLSGHLSIPRLPLESNLTVDQVQIHAATHLTGLHLGRIVAGRDLDGGVADLTADNDGLTVHGTARLGGIPAKLAVALDFRKGPPSQKLQTVTVSADPDARQLAAAGLDTAGLLTGPAAISAVLTERRDGAGDIAVQADLAHAGIDLAPLAWRKPPGPAARAQAEIRLEHDRLVAIDAIQVHGAGIDIAGRVEFANRTPSLVQLTRLALGEATDVHGELRWPGAGHGWRLQLAGPRLDISAQMHGLGHQTSPRPASRTLPAGTIDVSLGRLGLGGGREITGVALHGASDGRSITAAQLSGLAGPGDPFRIAIAPGPSGRRLTGDVPDLGTLLRATGITSAIEGGKLTLSGAYDDTRAGPGDRLDGTARLGPFRLRQAPLVAKLLQAMTLYGVLEAIQGPGLGVDGLDAPFSLTGTRLTLANARAYSASLGATVKGSIDLADSACALDGTIVPAYFFNTLPGKIPFIGRIFSPERGGGLFAATYAVRGDCNDPTITVNPLATLTPGFLRGIFGLFGGK
jgi:hypothetical protein